MNGAQRPCAAPRRAGAPTWLALLIVLAGVAVMAYPFASNWLAELHASRVISDYGATVEQYSAEEIAAAWEAAERYNENLAGDPVHDPFVPGSGYALPEDYEDVLNLEGDGVMGYLEIPSIGVRLPIYHGTSEDVLERGVGHIEQTALPIGSTGGHSVLTGHRGLPSAELFTRLDELEEGDLFYVHVLDRVMAYRVESTEVILPDELSTLAAEPGRDLVTLVTCTPYSVNTHRLLVHGVRTEYEPDGKDTAAARDAEVKLTPYEIGLIAGVCVLILLLAIALVRHLMRRRAPRGQHARR